MFSDKVFYKSFCISNPKPHSLSCSSIVTMLTLAVSNLGFFVSSASANEEFHGSEHQSLASEGNRFLCESHLTIDGLLEDVFTSISINGVSVCGFARSDCLDSHAYKQARARGTSASCSYGVRRGGNYRETFE